MERVLIVVDMQNDFVDGPLGTHEARRIVDGVCRRIREAHDRKEWIFLTLDTHAPEYLDTQEGRNLPVPHCIRNTRGWELHFLVETAAGPTARRIEKSTFGSLELARTLGALCQDKGLDAGCGLEVELCGLCTDICVITNALVIKAALPEARLRVDPALCAGATPQKQEAALEVLRSCQVEVL